MQGLFLSLLFAMGLAFAGIFRSQLDILTIGFLGFPLGAALWVIISLTVIILGIPYTAVTMFTLSFLWLMGAGFFIYKKKGITKSDINILAIITAVFIAILSLLLILKYAYVEIDSWSFLDMANDLVHNAGLYNSPARGYWWLDWGIFVGLIHAGANFLGFDYVYAYMPLLAFWFYLSFGWFLYKALKQYFLSSLLAGFLSIFAILIFISTYIMRFQAFYLHSNMTASVYFTFAVIGLWCYTEDRKVVWLILMTTSLIAFSLSRVEGSLVALCLFTVLISLEDISYKQVVSCVAAFMLIFISWHAKLLIVFGPGHPVVNNNRVLSFTTICAHLAIYGLFLAFTIFSKHPKIRKVKGFLPLIMLYILALVALSFTLYNPVHMLSSLSHLLTNMLMMGNWGNSWILILLLVIGGFFLKPLKNEFLFVSIVGSYFLFIYDIVFFRRPYLWGWTCSANRMLTHFFPVIIFYLFLKYAYNFPWQTTEEKK